MAGPDQQLTLGCTWIATGALWLTFLREDLRQTAVGMAICGLGGALVVTLLEVFSDGQVITDGVSPSRSSQRSGVFLAGVVVAF